MEGKNTMEQSVYYYPDTRYLIKLMMRWFVPIMIVNVATAISFSDTGISGLLPFLCGLNGAGLVLIFIGAHLYYNSLRYEIHEDEILMTSGVLTKSVKHVPFRTITNLTITRSLPDRILGIGSLQIQTAGASGTTAPEENLVGLENVEEIYNRVVCELRRFRGGMSPDQVSSDRVGSRSENENREILLAILDELRAIRHDLVRN
jgi:uncharacterized membrane protein YdbT with pleckstrin-like domain